MLGGFIVGFDSDGPDIFDRQVEFIQKAGIPTAMLGVLQALPNTPLETRMRAEGRLQDLPRPQDQFGRANFKTSSRRRCCSPDTGGPWKPSTSPGLLRPRARDDSPAARSCPGSAGPGRWYLFWALQSDRHPGSAGSLPA